MKALCLFGSLIVLTACKERQQSNLSLTNHTVNVDYVLTGEQQVLPHMPKQPNYPTGQATNVDYLLIGNGQSVPYPAPPDGASSGTGK